MILDYSGRGEENIRSNRARLEEENRAGSSQGTVFKKGPKSKGGKERGVELRVSSPLETFLLAAEGVKSLRLQEAKNWRFDRGTIRREKRRTAGLYLLAAFPIGGKGKNWGGRKRKGR